MNEKVIDTISPKKKEPRMIDAIIIRGKKRECSGSNDVIVFVYGIK